MTTRHLVVPKIFALVAIAVIAVRFSCAAYLKGTISEEGSESHEMRTLAGREMVGAQLQIVANKAAWDLADIIQGDGLTITSADLQCQDAQQAGIFDKADFLLGMERGAVISSAFVTNALGRNDESYPDGSNALGGPGYDPLDQLLKSKNLGSGSRDACILVLKFKCEDPSKFEFRYVFGSDDYPSSGDEDANDLMAAFVNGVKASDNIALTDNGDFVSVNTFFNGDGFKDNTQGTYLTEMNGFTAPRTASAKVGFGVNEIHIAVADGGLFKTNTHGAWLFIEAASMKCPATVKALTPKQCATLISDTCSCGEGKCLKRQARLRCGTRSSLVFPAYFKRVQSSFRALYC